MSEQKPMQQCPICGAAQPVTARTCSICGASLPGQAGTLRPVFAARPEGEADEAERPRYDPAEGGDDLYIGDLSGRMWRLMLAGGILLALVAGLAAGIVIGQLGQSDDGESAGPEVQVEDLGTDDDGLLTHSPTAPPTATPRNPLTPIITRTPKPTMSQPTITPAPPTPTITPTQGPCIQVAGAGDTVLGMAMRCGHRGMGIVDTILEMNDMESPAELQINQELIIPWPTPTPGGEPVEPTAVSEASSDEGLGAASADEMSAATTVNEFGTPDALAQYQNVQPTLRPGLAWHTVQEGEDVLSIAFQYDTNIETLSQINPEVQFLQCDFGEPAGGPNCSVMIYTNQRLRVPVPLPTPTLSPTPAGTLTPTPTASATVNAPYAIAPEEGARFRADEMITLRWGATGTLEPGERYLVRVYDQDAGETYQALIDDLSYILPGGWQPVDRNWHTYEWSVAVVTVGEDLSILTEEHLTEPRQFEWESR